VKLIAVGDLGVGDLLKESFVLIISHFTLVSVPNGLKAVHYLPVELDGVADELRELFDDLLNLCLS
jgi:hypothetical protein